MMKYLACFLVVLIAFNQECFSVDPVDVIFKNIGSFNKTGCKKTTNYYLPRAFKSNWMEALSFCDKFNMELLTLGSQEEYDNFQTIYKKNINDFDTFTNVGGVKQDPSSTTNDSWMWVATGETVNTTNKWDAGKPNGGENCLSLIKVDNGFKYDDLPCRASEPCQPELIVKFICQQTKYSFLKFLTPDLM